MAQYNLYKHILTLNDKCLFQENITFLGEVILFQNVCTIWGELGNSDSVPNNISSKSFESDAIQMVFSSPSSHDENLGSATTYSLLLPGHKKRHHQEN